MRAGIKHFSITRLSLLLWLMLVLGPPFAATAVASPTITGVAPSSATASVGDTVTWSVSVSGATGTDLYRFWLFSQATQAWSLLQDYSTSPTAAWTAAPGMYHVQVWAKGAASVAELDSWANSGSVTVTSSMPVSLTSANVSTTTPAVLSPVVFSASATGGTGVYEYRFYLYSVEQATWTLLQDYSASASTTWVPATAGHYSAQVWVRTVGSASAFDDWRSTASITVTTATTASLTSITPSSVTATVNVPVTFSATAAGGWGQYEFRFMVFDAGRSTWTLLQDYSTSASAAWSPALPGSYWVQTWVRQLGSQVTLEDWRNSAVVTVSPRSWTLTGATVQATPVQTGDAITWTAITAGSTDPLLFRFWLRNATAGTWQLLQDYSTADSVTFHSHRPARYYVQVWARSSTSTAEFDAWTDSAVADAVGPPPPDDPPGWTVVRTSNGQHIVTWDPVPDVDGYLILESTDRASLLGTPSTAAAASVVAAPYVAPGTADATPHYFRVFPVTEGVVGFGGIVAASTSVTGSLVITPRTGSGGQPAGEQGGSDVTAALWDLNGDGCLDLIGYVGACDGTFTHVPLDPAGTGLLFQSGRVNRDSRFADFTGDGLVDIFTNVYAPATDTASRAVLLVGQPDGTFRPDAGVAALQIGGFGETVVAADFDNDGDVDLYLPHYFDRADGAHSWLLVNDGHGVFTDVSYSAGVSSTAPFNPEGAQALDFNQDGWVDIAVATHLYINQGNLTFVDQGAAVGLPAAFDEGMLLFDADLDGDVDVVHHDAAVTRLHYNVNGRFDAGHALNGVVGQNFGFGLNVCDVNGDGYQDILVPENNMTATSGTVRLLLNGGGAFSASDLSMLPSDYVDLIACADLDNSGLPDILARASTSTSNFQSMVNNASTPDTLKIRVLGPNGERNQQGRAVRVRPAATQTPTLLRFVESGSAYMAQNGYDQLIGVPWQGSLEVSVRFGATWVSTTAQPGDALTFYADGTILSGLH